MAFEGFIARVAGARSTRDVASAVIDHGTTLFDAHSVGMYVLGRGARADEVHSINVPSRFLDRYEDLGRSRDPLLAQLRAAHAPCAASFDEVRLHAKRAALPSDYVELVEDTLAEARHYLLAPIVVEGEIAGTLNFVRTADRAFGERELRVASALALHVSTRMTALRVFASGIHASWRESLRPRALEIAELAATGSTVAEMGLALGISVNTVKKHLRILYEQLLVSSRAELATTLARPQPKR